MKSELPASRAHFHPPLAATAGRQSVPRAANDNHHGFTEDALLRAALRHFAEHGLGACGFAALIGERAFAWLDGPVTRLAAPDVPAMPFSPPLEKAFLIDAGKIETALTGLIRF